MGIRHWPYRKVRSLQRVLDTLYVQTSPLSFRQEKTMNDATNALAELRSISNYPTICSTMQPSSQNNPSLAHHYVRHKNNYNNMHQNHVLQNHGPLRNEAAYDEYNINVNKTKNGIHGRRNSLLNHLSMPERSHATLLAATTTRVEEYKEESFQADIITPSFSTTHAQEEGGEDSYDSHKLGHYDEVTFAYDQIPNLSSHTIHSPEAFYSSSTSFLREEQQNLMAAV